MDNLSEKLIIFWLTDSAFINKRAEIIAKFDPNLFSDLDLKQIYTEYVKAFGGEKIAAFNEIKMLDCMVESLGWHPYNLEYAIKELKRLKVQDMLHAGLGEALKQDSLGNNNLVKAVEKIVVECASLLQEDEKVNIKQILDDVLEERETAHDKGILTGIGLLDNDTKRLRGGHFWIIGGYTNVGKTGMMLQIIDSVCSQGKNAMLFSLEMTGTDLVDRLLEFNEWRFKNHAQAIDRVAEFQLKVFCRRRMLEEIIRTIRASSPLPDVVFIDFLQNIYTDGDSEYARITTIAQEIQRLAQDTGICIVGLSQISNESAGTKDRVLISFKGSGALAAACDVGIELVRESDKELDKNLVDIAMIVRKNRFGKRPRQSYNFDKQHGFICFNQPT